MSIELPKYSIQEVSDKPKKATLTTLFILLLVGIAIGFVLTNVFSKNTNKNLFNRNEVLEEINTKNQDQIVTNETQISLLKTEHKVQKQAAMELQQDYKKLLDKNNSLSSEIKFYESLLSPNSKNKGLRVFNAEILHKLDNSYILKIVLVQKIEKAYEITGKYKVSVIGKEHDKNKTITISKSGSKYKFKYFQNISYEFLLPKSFNPLQLVVELFPKDKKAKSVKHIIDWQIKQNR